MQNTQSVSALQKEDLQKSRSDTTEKIIETCEKKKKRLERRRQQLRMAMTPERIATVWRSGLECGAEVWSVTQSARFYDHDRKVNGLTPNLVSLLRPRTRCFTIIISAW